MAKGFFGRIFLFAIGIGLIIFAITPTPDDVLILPPIAAAGFGVSLIIEAVS